MSIIGAPEGVSKVAETHPDVSIYVSTLDRCLNENGYILPGLGVHVSDYISQSRPFEQHRHLMSEVPSARREFSTVMLFESESVYDL